MNSTSLQETAMICMNRSAMNRGLGVLKRNRPFPSCSALEARARISNSSALFFSSLWSSFPGGIPSRDGPRCRCWLNCLGATCVLILVCVCLTCARGQIGTVKDRAPPESCPVGGLRVAFSSRETFTTFMTFMLQRVRLRFFPGQEFEPGVSLGFPFHADFAVLNRV